MLPSPWSFVLHGKALVVKSRGQTSKYSVLTVRLGHSLRFAVPSFSPSSAPIMQAFAPVVGFSLPEHQALNRFRMVADFQVFSSDRYSCTYPVPAQLYASCNTSALLPCLLQHRLLSLSHAQSLHLHGWALGQRVFGQTSKCSVLLSSTCFAAARLFRLRSFFACPICEHCSCSRRIGIDYHLC